MFTSEEMLAWLKAGVERAGNKGFSVSDVGDFYATSFESVFLVDLEQQHTGARENAIGSPRFICVEGESISEFLESILPKETGLIWPEIGKQVFAAEVTITEDGEKVQEIWLGTIIGVMPSGKIYAPWTTNQTPWDVLRDSHFHEQMVEEAQENGFYVYCGDDGDFMVGAFIR